MKIAVIGTGMVGQSLAGRLSELGHDVIVGTRDVDATLARSTPDAMGNPPFSQWLATQPSVTVASVPDAAVGADVVVNATSGSASLAALEAAREHLAGTVLIDIANPLDFSQGMPPTLFVKDTDSLGEQIQSAFPDAKVVKALNTMTAPLMVNPGLLTAADHSVFVAGNDAEAKTLVVSLLESFGHTDVLDLGDITAARGTEMVLPIWLRLMGALGTHMFQLKIVR